MSLRGIDTSKWQAGLSDTNISADFIFFKATEGVGYVDPDCSASYAEAKQAGKLLGVYHFARPDGNDPISEANFFVDNVLGYIGEAVLALDWETEPKGNVAWAKQWLDHVFARTGVHPLIYMSLSTVNQYDWSSVAADYALWVARYWDMATDLNYDMTNAGPVPDANWANGYAMWQWTSRGRLDGFAGDLDCNIFYGDATSWNAFARVRTPDNIPAPAPEPVILPPAPIVIVPPVIDPTPVVIVPAPVVVPPVIVPPITPVVIAKPNFWQLLIQFFINIFKRNK